MPPAASKIMVIRHAEKPSGDGPPFGVTADGEKDDKSLTVRGWQRAGALACLFAPARGPLQSPALATPGVIFASQASPTKGSQRPPETIMPLAERIEIMPRTHAQDARKGQAQSARRAGAGDRRDCPDQLAARRDPRPCQVDPGRWRWNERPPDVAGDALRRGLGESLARATNSYSPTWGAIESGRRRLDFRPGPGFASDDGFSLDSAPPSRFNDR
jgi:hypothetical protein